MLKNLIKTSFRNLSKRKFYSIINIFGLAISIAFSFLLWVYVKDQLSYDKHFENSDQIFRVNADYNMNGKRDIYSNAPRPVGPTLKIDFPEILESTRVYGYNGLNVHTGTIQIGDKSIKSRKIFVADSTYFSIFKYDFVAGNPEKALAEPNSIVVTEELAIKLFGNTDVMGKTIGITESGIRDVKITGVLSDSKENTHLPIEAMISWSTYFREAEMSQWYGGHVYTYVLLDNHHDIKEVDEKFPAFFETHMKETYDELNGIASMIFQPINEIHLEEEYVWEPYAHGSKNNVLALSVVILFLIVFACINYVNLATARSAERAEEVGMRKTLGSNKRQLIIQFLSESVLLALISGVIALNVCTFMLPMFNDLSGLQYEINDLMSFYHIGIIILVSLFIGLLSGIYPALYLSSLDPIRVLKGKVTTNKAGVLLRKILVTSQYIITSILISSVIIVLNQTNFIKNRDIGFDKENIINVEVPRDSVMLKRMEVYLKELESNPQVVGTSVSRYSLSEEANHFTPEFENPDGSRFNRGADLIVVDADFIETVGLEILSGRNFIKNMASDEDAFLINETAMRTFGWEDQPLEGKMVGWGEDEDGNELKLNVLGVVEDFHLGVSYNKINPLILFLNESNRGGRNLMIRIKGNDILAIVKDLEASWNQQLPAMPFEYSFVDETLNQLYEKEDNFLMLLSTFSLIIILIASLGIIGLISFTTELKQKEIAVRKIHGASLKSIGGLLTMNFLSMLVLANIMALPVGMYLMKLWLDNFNFQVTWSYWPYVIAFGISVFFTMAALLYHTLRAAAVNPSNSLRNK